MLLIERARRYFAERLGDAVVLNHRVTSIEERPGKVEVDGQSFDLLIDATWGHALGLPMRCIYEATILLYYETQEPFPAVTLVDGPLASIYPTEDQTIFTLSSVPHTPLGRAHNAEEAIQIRNSVTRELVAEKVPAMEEQISRYVPEFRERFQFIGPQLSIKTKPLGSFDDRSCYVYRRGRKFHVMSGKIDTIFFAVERILSSIEAAQNGSDSGFDSTLREQISGAAR